MIITEQGAWCETLFGTEPRRKRSKPDLPELTTLPELTGPQSDYVEHCSGCHGMQGNSAPAEIPVLRDRVGYMPGRFSLYPDLSVEENLLLPPRVRSGGLDLPRIFELFPNLKERLSSQGTKLSGGEQQMLAIGRILRTGARLLLLDEPTEGLAPVIIQQIGKTIGMLKQRGFTILLVEQNFRFASTVADRYYVVENGRIIDRFANAELEANLDKVHNYLGV